MRTETAEEYMQNTYLANMKYASVPQANFSIKNNIFWYAPCLLLLDHKSNWIDDKLEQLKAIKPLDVLNSGLITLDVSFSLYDEKNNFIYESTYYGLKVGNNLKEEWIYSPMTYLKNRKYYGVSFAFPFLHSRKYHVYLNEFWHVGQIKFTQFIVENAVSKEDQGSSLDGFNIAETYDLGFKKGQELATLSALNYLLKVNKLNELSDNEKIEFLLFSNPKFDISEATSIVTGKLS